MQFYILLINLSNDIIIKILDNQFKLSIFTKK